MNEHEGWRLLTCIWLHAGVVHLLANMLSLVFIGIRLEQQFGFGMVLIIILITTIVAMEMEKLVIFISVIYHKLRFLSVCLVISPDIVPGYLTSRGPLPFSKITCSTCMLFTNIFLFLLSGRNPALFS